MLLLCIGLFSFLVSVNQANEDISCRDENGNNVDWYIVYKVPLLFDANWPYKSGYTYASVTSESIKDPKWQTGKVKVKEQFGHPFAETLKPIYEDNSPIDYIFYNDGLPNGTANFNLAHAKGVVAFDEKGGFWLIHSVPRFPADDKKAYSYPRSGAKFGQMALCISFEGLDALEKINNVLQVTRANVYFHRLNIKLKSKTGEIYFERVSKQNWTRLESDRYEQSFKIESVKSEVFTIIPKGADTESYPNGDIYELSVSPVLGSSLKVQSWLQSGRGPLPSECDIKYHIENVNETIVESDIVSLDWSTKIDHSKWALSTTSRKSNWCISDLNRMESQERRTGSVVCMTNHLVWKLFKESIQKLDDCN